jgi:hypothetical protein
MLLIVGRLEPSILTNELKEINFKNIAVIDLNEYLYPITGFQ